jgi:hypothetical protein
MAGALAVPEEMVGVAVAAGSIVVTTDIGTASNPDSLVAAVNDIADQSDVADYLFGAAAVIDTNFTLITDTGAPLLPPSPSLPPAPSTPPSPPSAPKSSSALPGWVLGLIIGGVVVVLLLGIAISSRLSMPEKKNRAKVEATQQNNDVTRSLLAVPVSAVVPSGASSCPRIVVRRQRPGLRPDLFQTRRL